MVPPILLCGLKSDLEDYRKVSPDCALAFADSNNMRFIEVSSKTGLGIDEAKQIVLELILRAGIRGQLSDSQSLKNQAESKKQKSGCC